jgi:hypothetical protein
MVLEHKGKGFALLGLAALAVAGLATPSAAQQPIPSGTVFTTYADNGTGTGPGTVVMLEPNKDPIPFGMFDPGSDFSSPWAAPIGVGPDGHVYVVSKMNKGSIWDITKGGDLTAASTKPLATGFWSDEPHKIGGIAFDAEGNAYLSLGETQPEDDGSPDPRLTEPIVRVNLKSGKVSQLNGRYNHAWGLAIRPDANKNEILYIVEGNTGRVLTYNLTTDKLDAAPFATGFPTPGTDHMSGALAFDPRGHLFVAWRMDPTDDTTGGLFDITNGGDFTNATPALLMSTFKTDVNGLVFDANNDAIMGGDNSFVVWMSPFDPKTGKFGDFVDYTGSGSGGGDNETMAIVP